MFTTLLCGKSISIFKKKNMVYQINGLPNFTLWDSDKIKLKQNYLHYKFARKVDVSTSRRRWSLHPWMADAREVTGMAEVTKCPTPLSPVTVTGLAGKWKALLTLVTWLNGTHVVLNHHIQNYIWLPNPIQHMDSLVGTK